MNGEHLDPPILGHGQCENSIRILAHFIHNVRHELHSGRVDVDEGGIICGIFLRGEVLITGREIFENSSR